MPNKQEPRNAAPGRVVCSACARPASGCICRWVQPVAHATEVLILQHPLEAGHAKNTGRLLHLCLPKSRLVVGESFAEAELLQAPWGDAPAPRQLVLLYPPTPLDQAPDLLPPPALDATTLEAPSQLRLVVLDGTWRKSRKMLYTSPLLQRLPRLGLSDMAPSAYRIRKAHRADQLSTFEAACAALEQLEGQGQPAKFQPLRDAFEGFVAQQAACRPS